MAQKKEESFEDRVNKIVPAVDKAEAALRELTPIKLIKDKQHTDDVLVRVNGYPYQIQRGVTVNVPKYVAEVLDHKEMQEQEALERSIELQIDPNDRAFQ